MSLHDQPAASATKRPLRGRRLLVWLVAGSLLPVLMLAGSPASFLAKQHPESKGSIKTCGKCPSGYATTGVTALPEVCGNDDPTLVQCVPLGASRLPAVCGSCPEGYIQVGNSFVPARCGTADGGRMSECQLEKLEGGFPDPSQGGVICPPNCGEPGSPGQGPQPPVPQYRIVPPQKQNE